MSTPLYTEKPNLFGSHVTITIFDMDETLAKGIIELVYSEGFRLQKIFNYYDKDSELSLLNSKRKITASPELIEVIIYAQEICKITNGHYNITLGNSIDKRKKGLIKVNPEFDNYKDIIISKNTIILNNSDIKIDLGSIAKGYIVDNMIKLMKKEGVLSGLIDARGDISVFGKPLVIGIQHPREKNTIIKQIKLKNQCVATSGDYNQFYSSYDNNHIINSKDIISITIVSDSLMQADVLSTALFASNPELRIKLINNYPKLKILTYNKNLKETMYNKFEKLIVK